LHDPTFSHFDTIPAYDRDRQTYTDRHTTTAYTVLEWHCMVKTYLIYVREVDNIFVWTVY